MKTSMQNNFRSILLTLTLLFIGLNYSYAQFNMGNTLAPLPGSLYPIVFSNDAKGGLHQVADIASRNAIPALRRQQGMLCFVLDAGSGTPATYQLVGGILDANWVIFASNVNTGNNSTSIDLTGKEDIINKIVSLTNSATDSQYPSAKLLWDQLALKQNSLINPIVRSDSTKIFATPYQLSQNIKSFETEISVNGVTNISLPFILKSTALVWCNGVVLKNNLWSGIGQSAITLAFNLNIYDLLKIQN
jgi:hypothetical protein